MPTTLSLRTTSAVALVALGLIPACGDAFSSAAAGNDAGPDAAADAADAADAASGFCASTSGTAFCDDFDDRSSGMERWSGLIVSSTATMAIDGASSVSAPHSLWVKASAGYAVASYNLPAVAAKLVVDFSIKVESLAVSTHLVRLASITASSDPDLFRLDLVKTSASVYELRASLPTGAIGDPLPLRKLSDLEKGWHRITWTTKPPTALAPAVSQVALDGESVGEKPIDVGTDKLKGLADVLKSGLRLSIGVVAPDAENAGQVRYDNVAVTGS